MDGQKWTCLDRGGKIRLVDGVAWIDFLEQQARYPHGTLAEAEVRWPDNP
jgi:hypothetical protein